MFSPLPHAWRRGVRRSQSVLRESVVSEEEARDALFNVAADDALHLVDGAAMRLSAQHSDNDAQGALERAFGPASGAFQFTRLKI